MKSLLKFWWIAGLFTALGNVSAQDTWKKQSVLPTDRSAGAVFALSPTRAIFVGENELILETSDAGSTWTVKRQLEYGTQPFYALDFGTSQLGLISGNNHLLRTTDGGATWQNVEFFGGSWSHIDWVSPTTVFVGANGACAASVDGGLNWQLRSGYPNCPVMFGMDFKDANVGLAGGLIAGTNDEGIFKTIDGGVTWVLKDTVAANDVLWTSDTRAIADERTTVRESTDGGNSWHTLATGITTGMVTIVRAGNSSTVIGVSAGGDVWRSTDLGVTWTQTFDGPGSLPGLWETHFADADHGWLVGPGAYFFYTSDGGLTWHQKNSGTNSQIEDIHMLSPTFGMAVGFEGYLFRTQNGGSFWDVTRLEVTGQIFGRDEGLKAVDVVDTQFAVAAGPGGVVFRTRDGGEHWESVGYPVLSGNYYIYDVDFVDRNLGYVYGVDFDAPHTHTLFRTRNGGDTWEWVDLGNRGGGTTLQFIDANHGWLTADNNFGLRTVDGGQTWLPFNLPDYPVGVELSKVRFLDMNIGWAAGWNGYVAKTSNGGASWQLVNIGTTEDHLFDVVPVSQNEIWLCGREDFSFQGVVYHTVNGGQTWSRQIVSPGSEFTYPYRFSALPTGDAWYGGYAGRIARRQTATTEVRPNSLTMVRGLVRSGSLTSVLESDDSRLEMRPGPVFTTTMTPLVAEFTGQGPSGNLSRLEFVVESSASSPVIQVVFQMFDYDSGTFVDVSSANSTTTDHTYTFELANPNRFTSPAGEIKCRINYKALGATLMYPWLGRLDLVRWRAHM